MQPQRPRLAGRALFKLLLVAVGSAALVACSATPVEAPRPTAPPSRLPVEGYLMDTDGAVEHLRVNLAAVETVGVDGVSVTSTGAGLTPLPPFAADAIAMAHSAGKKIELLVSNYSDSLGDFSAVIAHRLLNSAQNRATVANALAAQVRTAGFDGVQVDLESLKPDEATGLTAFVRSLRAALPDDKQISMAIMASPTVEGYEEWGYHLSELRPLVARFVLMAYDQHGPGWSSAGPVGGTPWVKTVLAALITAGVPVAQIDLGVAQYGYSWPSDGAEGTSLSVAQARARAGDRAVYDPVQQEWTATLADSTVLWWSDRDTLAARRQLAAEAGVHGLAVWELSLADPLT